MLRSITFRNDCAMHRCKLLLSLAAMPLAACMTPQEPPGCRQFDCIAIGEQQRLAPGLAARPVSVKEDSRCPIEAECVWAGRVVIETELELGHEVITVLLDSSEPMHINAGLLSVAEVAPDMSIQRSPIAPEHYRFAFRFVPDLMDNEPMEQIVR